MRKAKPKPITIIPMNYPPDKYEIGCWEMEYSGTPEFESIQEYILEGHTYFGLHELIDVNYEKVPIGNKERRYSLVAKVKNDIIAFVNLYVFKLDTADPNMFIAHICLHPKFQNKGYGTEILKEILFSPEKYVGVKPSYIFTKIDKDNITSQNLFKKFGFDFSPISFTDWLSAHTYEPRLISDSSPSGLGE